MRVNAIEVVGGGPAGLYAATLLKRAVPGAQVRVTEQNPPDATFGFGVVFSDQALGFLEADDGETNRRLFRTVLARAGVVPVEAANGRDGSDLALAAAAAGEPFDVILLDMQMPVLDGYAAAGRLRAERLTTAAGAPTPIVALTAHAMSGDRARCLGAGCTEYLSKPVRPADLLALVADFLAAGKAAAAPSPAADPAGPHPDRPAGCELTEEDADLWEVAAEFAADLPARVAELNRLLAAGDGAGLRGAAHRWKGAAGTLGFPQFDAPAAALETAPGDADDAALAALVADLAALTAAVSGAAGPAATPAGRERAREDSNLRPAD